MRSPAPPAHRVRAILAGFCVILWPGAASAHLVSTGMGPVYDGMGHLLLTPEDLVPVLALALYAGLRGARSGRWVLFLLPGAWLIGGLAGSALGDAPPWPLAAVSFLVLGALVAADLRLPSPVVAGLAVVMGLIHGFLNGAALNPGPGFPGLLGIAALLFVIVALVAAFVLSLKHAWTRIAVRVAGSWIFASGLLLVGWFVRAHR